jgi:hypothetical protein
MFGTMRHYDRGCGVAVIECDDYDGKEVAAPPSEIWHLLWSATPQRVRFNLAKDGNTGRLRAAGVRLVRED